MNTSESINDLAAALAKAQGSIEAAAKDGTNPHFRSRYATLGAIWDACRAPLAANGLAVIQTCTLTPLGVSVETMLTHASGQWVSNELEMPHRQRDSQGIGAAITYARRYALAAMVGVAPEDDESRLAAERSQQPRITAEQSAEVTQLTRLLALDPRVLAATLTRQWRAASVADLSEAEAEILIEDMRRQVAAVPLPGDPVPAPVAPVAAASTLPQEPQAETLQSSMGRVAAADAERTAQVDGTQERAMQRLLAAKDSFFALTIPGDGKQRDVRERYDTTWRLMLGKRGVTAGQPIPPSVIEELTQTIETRVTALIEERRIAGITCAAKEALPATAEPKSESATASAPSPPY